MFRKVMMVSVVLILIFITGAGIWYIATFNFKTRYMKLNKPPISKIIFVAMDNNKEYTLWISDNNAQRSNKKKIFSHKIREEYLPFDDSLYFSIGGVHLKGNRLYYCDLDQQAILLYNLKTGYKQKLFSGAFYPFYVNDNGSIFIFSTNINNKSVRTYKIYDVKNNFSKEFSFDWGYNAFIRPRELIKDRYILFDYAFYYTEGSELEYFLYDLEQEKTLNYDPSLLNERMRISLSKSIPDISGVIAIYEPK